jgi:GGDEF domain-containing protein
MRVFDKIRPTEVDRRELQLTFFACAAICVLAVGTALLMYPLVFSSDAPRQASSAMRIAFAGFCVLSVLLAVYLWDREKTIHRLREEMNRERRQVAQSRQRASMELLKTLPGLRSFEDHLAMEFRRAVTTSQTLSVLVTVVTFPQEEAMGSDRLILVSDAAKAICRKLRAQDSIYMLAPTCFAAVLTGLETEVAKRVSARIAEGLADAAGASHRFLSTISVVNYPVDAVTAQELKNAVLALVPEEASMRELAESVAD